MPDPRLVSRAQRAATMLERAWERWRSAHGLAAEPLPPVSSYVGYSIEEPWGRPRVVFGVAAEDAERLAAFLQDSLDRGAEADDGGPWPAARGGVPSGPAGTERGNLLEDVRGRIPVQGWPEFSESREQLNSSGAAGPDAAHSHSDHGDNGPAAVGGPPVLTARPPGRTASRPRTTCATTTTRRSTPPGCPASGPAARLTTTMSTATRPMTCGPRRTGRSQPRPVRPGRTPPTGPAAARRQCQAGPPAGHRRRGQPQRRPGPGQPGRARPGQPGRPRPGPARRTPG